jgi:hypothetical protein
MEYCSFLVRGKASNFVNGWKNDPSPRHPNRREATAVGEMDGNGVNPGGMGSQLADRMEEQQ